MFVINTKNFIKNNRKYFKLGICLILVSIITIAFYRSSSNLNIITFLREIKNILSPFIYGMGIAYVINPILKALEYKIFDKIRYLQTHQRLKRILSIATTYVLLISFLTWLISYLVPEIQQSIFDVSEYLRTFDIDSFTTTVKDFLPIDETYTQEIIAYISDFMTSIIASIPIYLKKIVSGTVNIASVIFNIILGIVISIYILFDKESIGKYSKRITCAVLSKKAAINILNFCKEANQTFEKFFVGKIIDSVIIGIIFFVGAFLLKIPFTLLLSIIIGVSNMIPFFGPFIGAIPVISITLLFDITNPLKALWIAIFILALQQFDGNILGPKILGNSIGVKPIGIIFAIIVGGAFFGPAGMFFGVPIFAVLFSVFNRFIDRKYKEKYEDTE